jgi:hypothetical protein
VQRRSATSQKFVGEVLSCGRVSLRLGAEKPCKKHILSNVISEQESRAWLDMFTEMFTRSV